MPAGDAEHAETREPGHDRHEAEEHADGAKVDVFRIGSVGRDGGARDDRQHDGHDEHGVFSHDFAHVESKTHECVHGSLSFHMRWSSLSV